MHLGVSVAYRALHTLSRHTKHQIPVLPFVWTSLCLDVLKVILDLYYPIKMLHMYILCGKERVFNDFVQG